MKVLQWMKQKSTPGRLSYSTMIQGQEEGWNETLATKTVDTFSGFLKEILNLHTSKKKKKIIQNDMVHLPILNC